MAKNRDVFWNFYQGIKECYFCSDYIHTLINDYHCLTFQRSSHFSSVTFSLFPEPTGKWESTLHFWKKSFQEASPTLPSQQAAYVETIVKIWHSAIDENRTCHLLQGLLWKLSLDSKSGRFILLSLLHAHGSYCSELFRLWKPAFSDDYNVGGWQGEVKESGRVPWEYVSSGIRII